MWKWDEMGWKVNVRKVLMENKLTENWYTTFSIYFHYSCLHSMKWLLLHSPCFLKNGARKIRTVKKLIEKRYENSCQSFYCAVSCIIIALSSIPILKNIWQLLVSRFYLSLVQRIFLEKWKTRRKHLKNVWGFMILCTASWSWCW